MKLGPKPFEALIEIMKSEIGKLELESPGSGFPLFLS